MRAKQWLVENGHLEKDGRGRMPLRVLPILQKAAESGVKFSDWPKGKVTVSEKTQTVTVQRDESMSNVKVVKELAPLTFPENEYVVFERVNGKRVYRSLREACNNCRVSLVQCQCGEPRIVARDARGSVSVFIERK